MGPGTGWTPGGFGAWGWVEGVAPTEPLPPCSLPPSTLALPASLPSIPRNQTPADVTEEVGSWKRVF